MGAFDSLFDNVKTAVGLQPADKEGRIVCAGCGLAHPFAADLRPWPPDRPHALRYCGECRLMRAVKGVS